MNRGLLHNWPDDVVFVVNGEPVTKGDILRNKRARQTRRLARVRQNLVPRVVPCFIWTLYVPGPFCMGWHLYVHSLRNDWEIRAGKNSDFILPIMHLYPCGLLPIIENFRLWKETFATQYPRATEKRPNKQGMVLARATVEAGWTGRLLEVRGWD
jgi:hypothetical protein